MERQDQDQLEEHDQRKPYQKPDIEESATFETLALGCDGQTPACFTPMSP